MFFGTHVLYSFVYRVLRDDYAWSEKIYVEFQVELVFHRQFALDWPELKRPRSLRQLHCAQSTGQCQRDASQPTRWSVEFPDLQLKSTSRSAYFHRWWSNRFQVQVILSHDNAARVDRSRSSVRFSVLRWFVEVAAHSVSLYESWRDSRHCRVDRCTCQHRRYANFESPVHNRIHKFDCCLNQASYPVDSMSLSIQDSRYQDIPVRHLRRDVPKTLSVDLAETCRKRR